MRHALQRNNLNVCLKLRTDHSDFYSAVAHSHSIENKLRFATLELALRCCRTLVVAADVLLQNAIAFVFQFVVDSNLRSVVAGNRELFQVIEETDLRKFS